MKRNRENNNNEEYNEIEGNKRSLNDNNNIIKSYERRKCPYLDTIDRQLLDFDMEKVCSITLSNMNIYSCLICGKFFQGRGETTPGLFSLFSLIIFSYFFILFILFIFLNFVLLFFY